MVRYVKAIPHLYCAFVIARASIALTKDTITKESVGEERIYVAYISVLYSIIEGSQNRYSNMVGT